jgi:hypothetical protein
MCRRRRAILAGVVVLVMAASACGEGNGLPTPGPDTREVKIYFASDSVLVGDVDLAKVVGLFSRGVRLGADGLPLEYGAASSDSTVATVEPAPKGAAASFSFYVRGRRPGWARVSATINGTVGIDSVRVVAR